MGQGLCSNPNCRKVLAFDNCAPTTFKRGYGWCNECCRKDHAKKYRENPEKFKMAAARFRDAHPIRIRESERTIKGKHRFLRKLLKKENVPNTDLLWSINFYAALMADKKCHYCEGELSLWGPNLDRMDSQQKHVCYNVVPCCRPCNTRKMHDLTYEERMLLAPILKQIRLSKESKMIQKD